jgi:hypothetical protein
MQNHAVLYEMSFNGLQCKLVKGSSWTKDQETQFQHVRSEISMSWKATFCSETWVCTFSQNIKQHWSKTLWKIVWPTSFNSLTKLLTFHISLSGLLTNYCDSFVLQVGFIVVLKHIHIQAHIHTLTHMHTHPLQHTSRPPHTRSKQPFSSPPIPPSLSWVWVTSPRVITQAAFILQQCNRTSCLCPTVGVRGERKPVSYCRLDRFGNYLLVHSVLVWQRHTLFTHQTHCGLAKKKNKDTTFKVCDSLWRTEETGFRTIQRVASNDT